MRRSLFRTAQQASSYSTRSTSTAPIFQRLQSLRPHQLSRISQSPSVLPSRRLYSSEPPKASDSPSENTSETSDSAEDPVKKELDAAKKEIIDLKDKYLRSVADFRNLQTITKRQIQADKEFAISRFAKDLLDSVDNLDRALSTVPEAVTKPAANAEPVNKDLQNLYDGLKMTESVLMSTLAKHGLERFDPAVKGERFDPNVHDASFMAPQAGKEDGTVFATIQKGFSLNGRVVRAAKVGVVKNS